MRDGIFLYPEDKREEQYSSLSTLIEEELYLETVKNGGGACEGGVERLCALPFTQDLSSKSTAFLFS